MQRPLQAVDSLRRRNQIASDSAGIEREEGMPVPRHNLPMRVDTRIRRFVYSLRTDGLPAVLFSEKSAKYPLLFPFSGVE